MISDAAHQASLQVLRSSLEQQALTIRSLSDLVTELTHQLAQLRREGFVPPPDPVRMAETDQELPEPIEQAMVGLPLDAVGLARMRRAVRARFTQDQDVEAAVAYVLNGESAEPD